jgi:hypothetical protein
MLSTYLNLQGPNLSIPFSLPLFLCLFHYVRNEDSWVTQLNLPFSPRSLVCLPHSVPFHREPKSGSTSRFALFSIFRTLPAFIEKPDQFPLPPLLSPLCPLSGTPNQYPLLPPLSPLSSPLCPLLSGLQTVSPSPSALSSIFPTLPSFIGTPNSIPFSLRSLLYKAPLVLFDSKQPVLMNCRPAIPP